MDALDKIGDSTLTEHILKFETDSELTPVMYQELFKKITVMNGLITAEWF